MTPHRSTLAAISVVVLTSSFAGCRKPTGGAQGGPAGSSSAPVVHAVPISSADIARSVNPENAPPYSGPTGSVRGTVTMKGDVAPEQPDAIAKIPEKCAAARDFYKRPFREGMMRSAADVLVAVTGYDGYVPAREAARRVEARGCTWGTRTVALTFGQRIDVFSKDGEPYLPRLVGARMPAQIVAVPGGDGVQLYPVKVGHYLLTDTIHPFMQADVYVLKFPTLAVTGLDGKFEISGIPVGEVTVSAFLPAIFQTAEKKLRIAENQTAVVDLELSYEASKAGDAGTSLAAPSAAASTRPARASDAGRR